MKLVSTLSPTRLLKATPDRLFAGLGFRLNSRPQLAAGILLMLRRLPGKRLRRAAYHQVSRPLCRRLRAELEIPVYGGCRMIVDTSDISGQMLATSGIWEPHVSAAMQNLLTSGDTCVDVGANIGYFTLMASKLVGLQGHVYALEPSPETLARLESNLALNDTANVTSLRVAAGASEGYALLSMPPRENAGKAVIVGEVGDPLPCRHDSSQVRRVPMRTLDSVLPPATWHKVRVVKIDVEGYEVEVLRGLEPTLESGHKPTLIVEVHTSFKRGTFGYLADLCSRFGLEACELVDDGRRDRLSAARAKIAEVLVPVDLASNPSGRNYTLLVCEQAAGSIARAGRW